MIHSYSHGYSVKKWHLNVDCLGLSMTLHVKIEAGMQSMIQRWTTGKEPWNRRLIASFSNAATRVGFFYRLQ